MAAVVTDQLPDKTLYVITAFFVAVRGSVRARSRPVGRRGGV